MLGVCRCTPDLQTLATLFFSWLLCDTLFFLQPCMQKPMAYRLGTILSATVDDPMFDDDYCLCLSLLLILILLTELLETVSCSVHSVLH